jgi:hypothetical protein
VKEKVPMGMFFGLIGFVLITAVFSFLAGNKYQKGVCEATRDNEIKARQQQFIEQDKLIGNCPTYDSNVPKKDYLNIYTVKPGDTLLSIARSQMGDASRVTELINLNKEEYPQLSMAKSFLEVGWKLFVLPKVLPRTNGNIIELKGEVDKITSEAIWVRGDNWVSMGNIHGDTVMPPTPVKRGDCVSFIRQVGSPERTISVKFQ